MRFIRDFFEKPIAFSRTFCYNSAINDKGGRHFVPFARYHFISKERLCGMNNTLIKLRSIEKSFDGERVLCGIDLDIHDKEFVTLLGPSGCGKTTTLRIIGGFESADTGDVYFDNEN